MVNTTTGAVVEKEAAPLKGFMQRLLGRRAPPPKAAANAPIAIAPGEADVVADVADAAPAKPQRTAAADIPLPRLSPRQERGSRRRRSRAGYVQDPAPPQGEQTLSAQVTYETTGSVPQEPPPSTKDAAPERAGRHEPMPRPPRRRRSRRHRARRRSVSASRASSARLRRRPPRSATSAPAHAASGTAVAMGDELLGDPADYYPHGPDEMAPAPPEPADIAALPARAAKATVSPKRDGVPLGAPFELIRTLQSLQDEMAQGSTKAVAAQRALRGEIERASFAAARRPPGRIAATPRPQLSTSSLAETRIPSRGLRNLTRSPRSIRNSWPASSHMPAATRPTPPPISPISIPSISPPAWRRRSH